jgi:hypothetical protein
MNHDITVLSALSELPEDSIRQLVMEFASAGKTLSVESIAEWQTQNVA